MSDWSLTTEPCCCNLCSLCFVELQQRDSADGSETLTGSAVSGGAALIFPTSCVHQHGVEPAGHQAVKHALALSLWHRLVLQEHVVVFDENLVEVKVSGGVMPVNLQIVVSSPMIGCWVLDL